MSTLPKSSHLSKLDLLNCTFKKSSMSPYGCMPTEKPTLYRVNRSRSRQRISSNGNSSDKQLHSKISNTSSNGQKESKSNLQSSASIKKILAENPQILNIRQGKALRVDQSNHRKKLSLNRQRSRTKLVNDQENVENRHQGEFRYCCFQMNRILKTTDDERFLSELSIFMEVLKGRNLGSQQQLVAQVVEAFERKQRLFEGQYLSKISEGELLLETYRRELNDIRFQVTTLKNQISVLEEANTHLKQQLQQRHNQKQQANDNPARNYTMKLENRLRQAKEQEKRFVKIIKILYHKGVNFEEVKQDLEDQDDSDAGSITDILRKQQPPRKMLPLPELTDCNLADNSVVNDSDESSFNFAGKPCEFDTFECKNVYKNEKQMPEQLRTQLRVDMNYLYESESEELVPTV